MVKILVCGTVNGEWKLLSDKIYALHKSSHGPFDLLFCAGFLFRDHDDIAQCAEHPLPLPLYGYDNIGVKTISLPPNVHYLPSMGTVTINDLVVGSMIANGDVNFPKEFDQLMRTGNSMRYDLLLTSDWPADMHTFLPDSDQATLSSLGYDPKDHFSVSHAVASLARALRPRYHMSSSPVKNMFYQRLPYENDNTSCTSIHMRAIWYTRFISLASVSPSKDKSAKWIHALSLDPATVASTVSLQADAAQIHTSCPYTPTAGAVRLAPPPPPGAPPAKRARGDDGTPLPSPAPPPNPPPAGAFFFGDMGVSRETGGPDRSASSLQQQAPSPDARTLFIGGLGTNVRERDFHTAFAGVASVRQPSGKNFAFVEFVSPASAQSVMSASHTPMGVSVKGRPVSVGWAAGSGSNSRSNGGTGQVLQSSPLSEECKTLFLAGLPPYVDIASAESAPAAQIEAEESLQRVVLELFPGSIKLQRLPGKTFAFLDFASHSAASLGMDSYVSNPEAYSVGPSKLSVGWSKSGGDNKRADGDANSSCWFCLASPSAKLHLVVSVSDNMYLALPRGGCNEWHVLIVPVECTSSRVQLSPAACGDLCRYESALEKLFVSKEMSSIRFERSMRTRGNKDHMQVQVVPLKRGDTQHALPAFMTAAGKYNLKFHEIPTGVSLEEALGHTGNPTAAIDGTTHEEYFYIELPISGSVDVKRRFVHVKAAAEAHSGRDGRGGFPMHFGMEVAANAMGRPERANWKNSLLSEAEEEQLAERFRDAFQKYDFT